MLVCVSWSLVEGPPLLRSRYLACQMRFYVGFLLRDSLLQHGEVLGRLKHDGSVGYPTLASRLLRARIARK
jgi:hypothetical protein